MPDTVSRGERLHPVHAILLAFPVALFPISVLTDIAYLRTQELQWTNFSAWLIAGGLVFCGLVLVWAVVSFILAFRHDDRRRPMIYAGLLAALFFVGFINALQHSRDGWSSVGALGLILSILSALLALAAAVIAHTRLFSPEAAR